MEKIVQTAGRKQPNEFAPDFAHYNDDVLFGENWNNHDIDHKTRCIITVVALMSSGVTDSSLKYHLENAKKAGVTKKGNCRCHHPCGILRWVAERLGGVEHGKRGVGRGYARRQCESRPCR